MILSSKLESSTSGPEKSANDSQQQRNEEGNDGNELSEVVLRKRSDTNPTSNLSSPTSNSSIHMSLINPTTGDQEKNTKVIIQRIKNIVFFS